MKNPRKFCTMVVVLGLTLLVFRTIRSDHLESERAQSHNIAHTASDLAMIGGSIRQYAVALRKIPGISSNGLIRQDLLVRDLTSTNNDFGMQFLLWRAPKVANERFTDRWGSPLVFLLTTNSSGGARITIRSDGPNRLDENGGGDDVVVENDILF
jgi:hypothetical protein